MSSFVKGLDESVCDDMRVYFKQYPREPLKELTRYADTLMKISERQWEVVLMSYEERKLAGRTRYPPCPHFIQG